jgi:hypothetical protein
VILLRILRVLAYLAGLAWLPATDAFERASIVPPETLKPVAALPAHIAGTFQDITACRQSATGQYFIFDRRSHSVYTVPPGLDRAQKLIEIGTEPGRVLDPTAFDLASDDTFVVADAPRGTPRIQIFLTTGSSLGGFFLPGRAVPRIMLRNLVLSGIGAVEYTGTSIFLSQPETGGVITEYSRDGRAIRTFGELRLTGQEADRSVHLALNAGLVVVNPRGGFYFVFLGGVPQFRRYDGDGRLMLERHVEGTELDDFIQNLPSTWKRQKIEDGDIPVVVPSVYAAAADQNGNLWISLAVGTTYVYSPSGDKERAVQFRAAGVISPTGMSFTSNGRILITPGCYAFPAR